MDRQEQAIAAEAAKRLCDAANRRAGEVGLYAGLVTAFLEKRKVEGARVDFFDAGCPHSDQPRLSPSCDCPGLAEVQARFTETFQQKLADTVVCFGNVVFVFSAGRVSRIEVTETFRIEREIPELARIFLPHLEQPATRRGARRGFANRERKSNLTARA